jgi:hypothetical protein
MEESNHFKGFFPSLLMASLLEETLINEFGAATLSKTTATPTTVKVDIQTPFEIFDLSIILFFAEHV